MKPSSPLGARFRTAVLTLSLAVVATLGSVSRADVPVREEPKRPSAFGATEDAPLPTVAPGDLQGLLRNCDAERERAVAAQKLCEQDKTGVDFLGAAYAALWVILMAFFALVALRQRRLSAELATLRERLARLGER